MDFSETNIPKILFSAIPKRFQDFSPTDFEDFMAQLLRDMGNTVEQTKYSGDFGADLILGEDPDRIVVQVKRYAKDNKVGVKDVNQVIGSKDYYKVGQAVIITTSTFTPQATELCGRAEVSMWDWDELLERICNTYFDGLDYFTFFEEQLNREGRVIMEDSETGSESLDSIFDFKIVEFQTGRSTAERYSQDINILLVEVRNKSQNNISVDIYVPDYVTAEHRQIEAMAIWSAYYSTGVIYAGSAVTLGFFFKADQLTKISANDKLVLQLKVGNSYTVRHFVEIQSLEGIRFTLSPNATGTGGGSCFIATALYGKDSFEYRELTLFRDNIVQQSCLGRSMVRLYYNLGPRLVAVVTAFPAVKKAASLIVSRLAGLAQCINKSRLVK